MILISTIRDLTSHCQRARISRGLMFLLLSMLLTACSVVDPYRILTRTNMPPPTPSVPVPGPDDHWKRDALEFVWTTVNERYYDPKFNGVDWRAVRTQYEPRLLAAKSDDEYWDLLDKMTGELKDSHTRIHSPKLVAQQRNGESHGLGLGFIEHDGVLVVTSVHNQSDAFWAGVRAGMTITQINGEPAMDAYRKLVAESRETSTPWARARGAVARLSRGDIDTVVNITFQRNHTEQISVAIKRRKFSTAPSFIQRVLPSGHGYIYFSNFIGGMQGDIITAIDRMKDTPGMIIDLRNNGGGSANMVMNLLNRFFKTEMAGVNLSTRRGEPITLFFIPTMSLSPKIKGAGELAYNKPVVVLTNESSASASEAFSVVMKESGRATIIGTHTCGCLLSYMGLADVPGGAQMAYSEIGFKTKNGSRVEGEGVAPHIVVRPSRDDMLLNRDRVLERAIAHLSVDASKVVTPTK